jgi:hypothetical protein
MGTYLIHQRWFDPGENLEGDDCPVHVACHWVGTYALVAVRTGAEKKKCRQ